MNKRKAQILIGLNALVFPIFLLFFYSRLPANVPMHFSLSGEVSWSLPTNIALICFAALFLLYAILVFFRYRQDPVYPMKDTLAALLLPEIFIIVLILSMIIK